MMNRPVIYVDPVQFDNETYMTKLKKSLDEQNVIDYIILPNTVVLEVARFE